METDYLQEEFAGMVAWGRVPPARFTRESARGVEGLFESLLAESFEFKV